MAVRCHHLSVHTNLILLDLGVWHAELEEVTDNGKSNANCQKCVFLNVRISSSSLVQLSTPTSSTSEQCLGAPKLQYLDPCQPVQLHPIPERPKPIRLLASRLQFCGWFLLGKQALRFEHGLLGFLLVRGVKDLLKVLDNLHNQSRQ